MWLTAPRYPWWKFNGLNVKGGNQQGPTGLIDETRLNTSWLVAEPPGFSRIGATSAPGDHQCRERQANDQDCPCANPHGRTLSESALDNRAAYDVCVSEAELRVRSPRRDVASLPERLAPPMPSHGWRGWVGPLAAGAVGGALRFYELGRPHDIIFDETYYPKEALGMLDTGTEQALVDNANDLILASDGTWQNLAIFSGDPAYVVHPSVGKWTIALGEYIFGATPFGWRFMMAVLGTLSIVMVARITRRLLRSDLLGTLAGLLLAIEGLHLVMSRTGLLDLTVMFWVLAAFGLLLIDRDSTRARLARIVSSDGLAATATTWGPRLGLRPWRWAAAVALGLACASKWSGIYVLAAFGLMTVVWDISARRAVGVGRPWRATLLRDAPFAGLSMVGIAVVVYISTWSGWIFTRFGYGRDWADDQPASIVPDWLRSLWNYHQSAWNFHVGLDSEHSYASNPLSWPLLARPVVFHWEQFEDASRTCGAAKCVEEVTALSNPLIWWAGVIAVLYLAWRWIGRRDWRAAAILVGVMAGWLPWMLYLNRTIFSFYTIILTPFLVMAVTMGLGAVLGPPGASRERRRLGIIVAGIFVVAAILVSWWFYPVWTAEQISYDDWRIRMWLPSWI